MKLSKRIYSLTSGLLQSLMSAHFTVIAKYNFAILGRNKTGPTSIIQLVGMLHSIGVAHFSCKG